MLPGVDRVEVAKGGIETLVQRVSKGAIRQPAPVPLADQRRRVAARFYSLGDGDFGRGQIVSVRAHRVVDGVAASEHTRARRRTQRGCRVPAAEYGTFGGQAVEVGSGPILAPVETDV